MLNALLSVMLDVTSVGMIPCKQSEEGIRIRFFTVSDNGDFQGIIPPFLDDVGSMYKVS